MAAGTWQDDENDAIVADYFAMLAKELAGQPFSKTAHRRALQDRIDRTARHAVEYQGGGHHQGAASARDAVKKEALRRAGIPYHEVVAGRRTPSELRRLIETLVDVPIAEIPDTAPAD